MLGSEPVAFVSVNVYRDKNGGQEDGSAQIKIASSHESQMNHMTAVVGGAIPRLFSSRLRSSSRDYGAA